jgi:glutamine amidotransferase
LHRAARAVFDYAPVTLITIVDYDAGNLHSVKRACDAVGLRAKLSRDPDEIARASKVIFPGVGAARRAMEVLRATGLDQALIAAYRAGTPILGVCLGSQIVLDRSEEGNVPCLGLIAGETKRFVVSDPSLKIPHMGWNEVTVTRPHPLLTSLVPGDEVYFVHSYYPAPADPANVYATSDHGGSFCCALGSANLFAMQFHPEKSGTVGLKILESFSRWEGQC